MILELGVLPPGILRGTLNSVTFTIAASDSQAVSLLTIAQEVAEGYSLDLEFTRTGGDQSEL